MYCKNQMKNKLSTLFGLIFISFSSLALAIPFDNSLSVMNEMKNDENKELVAYVQKYTNDYAKRQSDFIKTYGKSLTDVNRRFDRLQNDINSNYNIKDEDGDIDQSKIIDKQQFETTRESFDLNKILEEKKKIKSDLIIKYFKKEVESYKTFVSSIDKVQVSLKTKGIFKQNLQQVTKTFTTDIPQNISQSLSNETNMMNVQNPLVVMEMQKILDISYASMFDFMNNALDMNLSNALINSLAATPKIHRDPIN